MIFCTKKLNRRIDYNSYLDFFLLISFIYAAVMIPVGRAITAMPTRADTMVIIRPEVVTGGLKKDFF